MSEQLRRNTLRTATLVAAVLSGVVAVMVSATLGLLLAGLAVVVFVILGMSGRRARARVPQPDTAAAEPMAVEAPIDIDGIHRRRALKLLGLGALGAVPVVAAPGLVERIVRGGVGADGAYGGLAASSDSHAVDPAARIRQWTMIIDLRYCDGCQSNGTAPQCTLACIEGHFVPEPMQWIEVFESELAGGGTQFIPTPCQQCQNPPCVNVCPVGATFSTPEGVVLIDQNRCIGCRICMAACPYDRRFFNWGDPPVPPEAHLADYSPDHQSPPQRGTGMKCDFCPDRAHYGDLEEDIATNGKGIVAASRFLSENQAYQLKAELGTEPRVFYVPGHGEMVGRDPFTGGRTDTEWPWVERATGADTWSR
jgi:molybdopterin-containing oxidoreductase family iron-sulfur binding subunit